MIAILRTILLLSVSLLASIFFEAIALTLHAAMLMSASIHPLSRAETSLSSGIAAEGQTAPNGM